MDEESAAREDRLDALREKRYAQEAADRRDAARYRYLRDKHVRKWDSVLTTKDSAQSLDLDFSAEGHCLDAAIDRAMGKTSD